MSEKRTYDYDSSELLDQHSDPQPPKTWWYSGSTLKELRTDIKLLLVEFATRFEDREGQAILQLAEHGTAGCAWEFIIKEILTKYPDIAKRLIIKYEIPPHILEEVDNETVLRLHNIKWKV